MHWEFSKWHGTKEHQYPHEALVEIDKAISLGLRTSDVLHLKARIAIQCDTIPLTTRNRIVKAALLDAVSIGLKPEVIELDNDFPKEIRAKITKLHPGNNRDAIRGTYYSRVIHDEYPN